MVGFVFGGGGGAPLDECGKQTISLGRRRVGASVGSGEADTNALAVGREGLVMGGHRVGEVEDGRKGIHSGLGPVYAGAGVMIRAPGVNTGGLGQQGLDPWLANSVCVKASACATLVAVATVNDLENRAIIHPRKDVNDRSVIEPFVYNNKKLYKTLFLSSFVSTLKTFCPATV